MGDHSFYAPSSMDRVYSCPVSVLFNQKEQTSEYAEEGTQAHVLAEMMLKNPPDVLDGFVDGVYNNLSRMIVNNRKVPHDMVEHVHEYALYVNTLAIGSLIRKIEFKVNLSYSMGITEEQFGTIDVFLYDNEDTIYIIDLKYGKGIRVNAYNNKQLKTYAIGAMRHIEMFYGLPVKKARCIIYQPRLSHIDEVQYSNTELHDYECALKNKIWEAQQYRSGEMPITMASYNPGDKQCQWCQRKAKCPGLRHYVYEQVNEDFNNV